MNMKIINLALIACVASLMACNSEKTSKTSAAGTDGQNDSDAPGYVIENVSYKDSVMVKDSKAVAQCSIGYIKSGGNDKALVSAVDKWTRHMVNVNDTSVAMGEPLAKYVVKNALDSNAGDLRAWVESFGKDRDDSYFPMTYEFDYAVKPMVVTPRYVTMLFTSYVYTGGAHGGAAAIGQTFAADNGMALNLDMFKEGTADKVLELVKKGLMEQYFEVSTEKEFKDMLLVNNGTLPFPANPPYFEEKGVCFLYQQYEIAPYSSGMPACVIPYDTLRPYFTDAVLKLLDI